MPTISFCIPTRNFGPFIGTTLSHLKRELQPGDEIVIVDGNSTDNTADIVQDFQRDMAAIRYERLPINGGVDRDLARAVELARGDYCWLFSADDGLVEGAVARVRSELAAGCDVLLMERVDCDLNLRPVRRRRWMRHRDAPVDYRLADESSMRAYLADVRSLAGLLSYVSSIVVRHSAWTAVEPRPRLWGTHYAHVGRLLEALQKPDSTLRFVPWALVLSRGENDSFALAGRVRRFMVDVDGYQVVADEALAGRRSMRAPFFEAFRRDHGLAALSGVRMRCESAAQWRRIVERLRPLGYSDFTLRLADLLGRVKPLVAATRALRNYMQRRIGAPDAEP